MRRALNLLLPGILLSCCSFSILFAQVNTAGLSGHVADTSGAAMADIHVKTLNRATGYLREMSTDRSGYYTFLNMPIGSYTVTVEENGFATAIDSVELNVGGKSRRDFTLRLQTVNQVIEVREDNSSLSPDDASISTLVDQDVIANTPLYLRNWDDLLRAVPGVQISRYTEQAGSSAPGRTGDFNVNGVHSLQNNFILDGIDNNTFSENVQELSTEVAHPSVDVIQQFNIITNPYSAEYGRSPGAVVSINTKGGTNAVHGALYEYIRNSYFDANDFFSNLYGFRRPENNQNQFGASIGGPLRHNKLFYFSNYEGTRIREGVSRTSTVPLPNERIGDFSPATAARVGVTYPIIVNPSTGQPFANNQIPSADLDPAIQAVMALFPQPNVPHPQGQSDLNNYARNALTIDNNDSYDERVDWTPSTNNVIFGRYNYANRSRMVPGYLGGLADGSTNSAWGHLFLESNSFVIGWTHVFRPSVLNDLRFGFIRDHVLSEQLPFSLPQTAGDYIPGIPDVAAAGGGLPLIKFSSSYAFIGSPIYLPKEQAPQQFQYNDTLAVATGKHNLKFGATLSAPMRNIFQDEAAVRGSLDFESTFTHFAYADGLLGLVNQVQLTNNDVVDQRLWMAAGFLQDDWKILPRLTLNLGLRYEFATPPVEGKNRLANFNPSGAGSLVFAHSGSLADRALVDPNKKDFAPRVALAYSPDTKTVLRVGYGTYYTSFERFGSEDELALNPPFLLNKEVTASAGVPALVARQGFSNDFLDPNSINSNNLQSFHIRAVSQHAPSPTVQQWSLGFQREIASFWTLQLDYVGTKSTHLDLIYDYNQPLIVGNHSTGLVPYPNFGYIEYTTPIGYGNYNGLQGSLVRRMQNGLTLRASFTYSRSLDNSPEELENGSGGAPNGRAPGAWYGPSDFDVPHRVSVNYIYEPHFGYLKAPFLRGILEGFRTSGVYTFYSGIPYQINAGSTLGNSLDPYGAATNVPNLIGKPHTVGKVDCWFYASQNQACRVDAPHLTDSYSLPNSGYVGDLARNTMRGPHTSVFDAALLREFPLEHANLEFRWEVFNMANTPLFGQPNGDFSSGAAGQITTLSGDQRTMQFALRLSF
ncbi:TonB-dependent receptor [Granulicella mallensis]|uniref:TonB-dependent receptor plug n=1 Tax=Granulicella mallensis (strain ATCC BAA-1857 / DSM 23137 / MP5ACTX8) TaxID=682795 RepID=G8NVQ2_GRAMM|nr:carboxypeptidase regulatory-like domain-containing protein [Granulicella mallensis]AEU37724.1 TonB-dependent receptor plug [Granulicella mallensis MP5ACTX8]